jgi:hypothetical protein
LLAALPFVVILRLQTTLFHSIPHLTKYEDRQGGHAPLLVLAECLIERFPRIRYLLKVCGSLSQGISTSMLKGDRITVAYNFDSTALTQFVQTRYVGSHASLPILRSAANSGLHGWPVFFLVGCQLQCGLHEIDPRIRQTVKIRYT